MKNHAHANRTMHTLQSPAAAQNRGGSKTVFNASVVTILSVAERGLGFLYRVVLSRLIGAEGLGLYHVALSLFSVFLTIGTGGIPITVSRFISKSKAENDPLSERRALTAGLTASLLLTLPVCIFFLLFAEKIPFMFSDERSIPLFRILICGLVFSSLYAVLRGHFWGNKQFLLPSVLEIAEEAVMVIVGVLLLKNVLSPMDGATKASFAVLISYLFSFTAAVVCFFVTGGKLSSPRSVLKPLFSAAMPVTGVRASSSLIASAVSTLLPVMLIRVGYSQSEALQMLGIVSGMAMPILFIPSTVIGSLALVLVPELSEDFYRKNTQRLYKNIGRGLRFSVIVACFLLPFFYAFGDDIGKIAYAEPLAGAFIRMGSPILLPMSVTMITSAMLNSMGFEKQTFRFYFISAAAMFVCLFSLPSVCGAYAYIAGQGASYVLNAVCNLLFLHKKCPELFKRRGQVRSQPFFRVLPTTFFLCLAASLFSALLKNVLGELPALFCAAASTAALSLVVYAAIGVLPVKALFQKRKPKKPRLSAKKSLANAK